MNKRGELTVAEAKVERLQAELRNVREAIRQLEIERDDYKNAWVATLHGYRIYQVYGSTLWYADNPEGGRIYGPSPMWPLAARAAMNAAKGQAAGKAAEYLEGTKK